jgi:hypothetical protein
VHVRRLAVERERVVEVLGGLGIDRDGREVAEVSPPLRRRRRRRVRLELLPCASFDEQSLEDVFDLVRGAEDVDDLRAAASEAGDDEIAGAGRAKILAVEADRRPGREVRVADDELAAPGDLHDDEILLQILDQLLPVSDTEIGTPWADAQAPPSRAQRRNSPSAACSASSGFVARLSTATRSGSTPRRSMSRPVGVR